MISIIIPVYNEPRINETILALRKQEFQEYEIIVVDNQEDAATLDLIEDDKVRKVVSRPGRAIQMNAGARHASGDVYLFLHADCKLPNNGLTLIDQVVKNGIKGGAFDVWFESKNWLLREVFSRLASWRSRLFKIPYGDQGHFFQKDLFSDLGGYAEIPLMEDIQIMKRIKSRGEPIFIIPKRLATSARRWEEEGTFFVMLRNPVLLTLYYCGVPAEKLSNFYPYAKNRTKSENLD